MLISNRKALAHTLHPSEFALAADNWPLLIWRDHTAVKYTVKDGVLDVGDLKEINQCNRST